MLGDSSALQLVLSADPALLAIVRLSLWVSLAAVVCAALAGLPLGALIALTRFPGREAAIVVGFTDPSALRCWALAGTAIAIMSTSASAPMMKRACASNLAMPASLDVSLNVSCTI